MANTEIARKQASDVEVKLASSTEYRNWIRELKDRYRATQIKAAVSVNSALLKYYLDLPAPEELQRELLRERAAIEEAMLLRSDVPNPPRKRLAPKSAAKKRTGI